MYRIRNILVTTDFSEFSASAVDHAMSIAQVNRASIHVIHVVDHRPSIGASRYKKNPMESVQQLEKRARYMLQKFAHDHIQKETDIKQVIAFGCPAEEIVQYAREHDIDVIVIATHGRTGLAHVFMGSVAEEVIRRSPVPVLSVKPKSVLESIVTEADIVHDLHLDTMK